MLLDKLRDLVGLAPAKPAVSSEFMKGEVSPFFFNWRPALRDTRDDVRQSYMVAAARAVDAIQNSGWLAGAINQSVASTMGNGLRLASKPDAAVLGWTQDEVDEWSQKTERAFEAWSLNPMECDARGVQTLGQLARSVMMSYYSHGEAVALLPMVSRHHSATRTKVKLIPPHKLLQDTDGAKMFQGVTMDGWGMPVSYRMSLRVDQMYERIIDIPARDEAGRPQVIHVFDGGAEQVRGITPMAPALRIVRQFDQLADATLTAALIQAIFAATIESEAPTNDVLQALQDDDEQGVGPTGSMAGLLSAKAGWYESTKIDLGKSGKIAHLFPGERLIFNGSKTPNDTYESFAKFLLREIARCLGMTFETLTGDYTAATYSSVRMATSELWPMIVARRVNIPGRFYQMVYEAWLEEAVETGRINFKGGFYEFLKKREAISRAEWRGPPKPQADDLKTQKAHEGYKRMGIMTDEMICNDLGVDVEDVYRQRAAEKKMRAKYKLPDGDTMTEAQDDALTASLLNEDNKAA